METTAPQLSPMIRQDLISLAKGLPYTGKDHESIIIERYEKDGWQSVDDYIDIVKAYVKISNGSNRAILSDFLEKMTKWVNKIYSSLSGLINR